MLDTNKLAARIEADRKTHVAKPRYAASQCVACGRAYQPKLPSGDDSTRFCSDRCRNAFDAGFPAYEPPDIDKYYSLPKGPTGFYIHCANCQARFDSRGLRCCSTDCERRYRERADTRAVMAEVDMEPPAKRMCEAPGCGNHIPKWRGGRRVSKTARFCSDKCSARARKAQAGFGAVLSPET